MLAAIAVRSLPSLIPFRMVSGPFSPHYVEKPLNMLYLAFAEQWGWGFRPAKSKLAKHLRLSSAPLASLSLVVCGIGIAIGQIAQQDPVPVVNVGGNYMEAQFARLEFAQKVLEEQNRKSEEQRKQRQKLLDTGTVSALDLQAPGKAVSEFNKGAELLQHQKSREAIAHLERGLAALRSLPTGWSRDSQEIELQLALGLCSITVKGMSASVVGEAYARAHELAQQCGSENQLFQALYGRWQHNSGSGRIQPFVLCFLAEALGRRGDYQEAHAAIRQALNMMNATGERMWNAELHRIHGFVLLAENKREESEAWPADR